MGQATVDYFVFLEGIERLQRQSAPLDPNLVHDSPHVLLTLRVRPLRFIIHHAERDEYNCPKKSRAGGGRLRVRGPK